MFKKRVRCRHVAGPLKGEVQWSYCTDSPCQSSKETMTCPQRNRRLRGVDNHKNLRPSLLGHETSSTLFFFFHFFLSTAPLIPPSGPAAPSTAPTFFIFLDILSNTTARSASPRNARIHRHTSRPSLGVFVGTRPDRQRCLSPCLVNLERHH
jgi:hypothetical protein